MKNGWKDTRHYFTLKHWLLSTAFDLLLTDLFSSHSIICFGLIMSALYLTIRRGSVVFTGFNGRFSLRPLRFSFRTWLITNFLPRASIIRSGVIMLGGGRYLAHPGSGQILKSDLIIHFEPSMFISFGGSLTGDRGGLVPFRLTIRVGSVILRCAGPRTRM